MAIVEGDAEIVPGVELVVIPGHTRHMQCVKTNWWRPNNILCGGFGAHRGAPVLSVDHGFRSLPDDHARKQEEVASTRRA